MCTHMELFGKKWKKIVTFSSNFVVIFFFFPHQLSKNKMEEFLTFSAMLHEKGNKTREKLTNS